MWNIPRIWEGGDVWIIGGGPSIFKQFAIPDTIVRNVVDGISSPGIYSPYMKSIHSKHVIGVNIAYMLGNWIDLVFFGDKDFFLKNRVQLAKFPNLRVSCHDYVSNYKWMKHVPKDGNHRQGITSAPNKVSWNMNSGAAAINLAVQLGAKRIFLLGFDMTLNENDLQHFHGEYRKGKTQHKRSSLNLPFSRHLKGFPAIKKEADALGVDIINVNPDSAIKEFKKMTLKEALDA